MWLRRLDVDGVRNLRSVRLDLCPGVVGFFGPNGAGKTSLLESVYCLSSGRSFRSASRTDFIGRAVDQATLFAEVVEGEACRRLGLSRSTRDWQGRLDGERVTTLEGLARSLAVQVFHPRLHQLIEGTPEERRRFLDFGVFHVEPDYFRHWRDYRRALKQRNAVLRSGGARRAIQVWDATLVPSAGAVTALRERVTGQLERRFARVMGMMAPELGRLSLSLYPGWRAGEDYTDVLRSGLERDRQRAHTSAGPHRADLRLRNEEGPVAGILSRGQQKTVVLGLTLAMQDLVGGMSGRQPVLCIDDFSSELDESHQSAVLEAVRETGAQVLLTGTEMPPVLARKGALARLFHVEHGTVELVL